MTRPSFKKATRGNQMETNLVSLTPSQVILLSLKQSITWMLLLLPLWGKVSLKLVELPCFVSILYKHGRCVFAPRTWSITSPFCSIPCLCWRVFLFPYRYSCLFHFFSCSHYPWSPLKLVHKHEPCRFSPRVLELLLTSEKSS